MPKLLGCLFICVCQRLIKQNPLIKSWNNVRIGLNKRSFSLLCVACWLSYPVNYSLNNLILFKDWFVFENICLYQVKHYPETLGTDHYTTSQTNSEKHTIYDKSLLPKTQSCCSRFVYQQCDEMINVVCFRAYFISLYIRLFVLIDWLRDRLTDWLVVSAQRKPS